MAVLKRKATKKKRTAKQIAATKKLVALNKKRRGKTATKKKTVKKKTAKKKKAVGRVSQVTKKRPTARLKRRRAKPKKKGYFPNPIDYAIVYLKESTGRRFYFDGEKLDTNRRKAARFTSKSHAEKIAKQLRKISKLSVKVERLTPK